MALINRPAYAELVEGGTIDIAISPQQVTIGALLAHVRRGDVVRVHSLRRGAAEAIEAIVRTARPRPRDRPQRSRTSSCPRAPRSAPSCAASEVLIAHHDTVIEPDDHVILFVTDRRQMEQVGALFQATASRA